MHFVSHSPLAPLDNYVHSIFHFKHFMPDHAIERVVPNGYSYLIFELDGYQRHLYHNDSLKPKAGFSRAWLSGMHKHYISISAHQDSEMFVIQFKPGGLSPFLPQPVCNLNNRVIPAEMLFADDVLALREELKQASEDDQKMFKLAEAFLIKQIKQDLSPARQLVEHMLAAIQRNSASQLQDIIAQSAYSKKQAIHLFKQHVGLNPKSFQRIVRFNEILPLIMEKKSIAWQDICADCYYYDQSHFIREFKAFCGYNPGDFIVQQASHPEPNFFPLDQISDD